jgi:hypothetical protein
MINENACEVFMNDVMEGKCSQECEINPGLQRKTAKI